MKIVAVASYRFDGDYVDDLKANVHGLADQVILRHDPDGALLRDEGRYRREMIESARQAGADWALVVDPDERFERRAVRRLRALAVQHAGEKVLFEVAFRELYTPRHYRVDGVWATKTRVVLFPLFDDNLYSDARLHTPRQPLNPEYRLIRTGLNLYHLKHIEPALRTHRKQLYNKLDPELRYNSVGYDYLDDETGMQLERIGWRRGYRPRYRAYEMDPAIFQV